MINKQLDPKKSAALCTLFILSLLLSVESAHAGGISLVGDLNLSTVNFSPTTATGGGNSINFSSSRSAGFGAGALFEFDLVPMFSLEVGALYITRKTSISGSANNVTDTISYTANAIRIPLLLRVSFMDLFSIGAGPYVAIGTGNINASNNNAGLGTTTVTDSSYSSNGLKNKDYGLTFSARVGIPLLVATSFIIDGRYNLDLTDVNGAADQTSPSIAEKYRDLEILAGLKFTL